MIDEKSCLNNRSIVTDAAWDEAEKIYRISDIAASNKRKWLRHERKSGTEAKMFGNKFNIRCQNEILIRFLK